MGAHIPSWVELMDEVIQLRKEKVEADKLKAAAKVIQRELFDLVIAGVIEN